MKPNNYFWVIFYLSKDCFCDKVKYVCVQKGTFLAIFFFNTPMCGLMFWENTSIVTTLWSYCQGTFCFASVEMVFLWPVRISWQSWIKMFWPEPNLGNCIFFSLINSIVSIRKELFLPAQNTVSVEEDGFEMFSRWRWGFVLNSRSLPCNQSFEMADPVFEGQCVGIKELHTIESDIQKVQKMRKGFVLSSSYGWSLTEVKYVVQAHYG